MERRRYTDEERAACLAALAANGGNVKKTARECGVPRMTLKDWILEGTLKNVPPPSPEKPVAERAAEILPEATQALDALFERFARKAVRHSLGRVKDLNAKDAMVSAGIAVDKMRLLRGQSTDNCALVILKLSGQSLDDL